MKKIISTAIATAMAASMALPTVAATELTTSPSNNNGAGDYTIGIDGTYVAGATDEGKISVDIAWESMDFTYTAGDSSYDVTTHKTTTKGGTWSTNTAAITVTNHSNVAMSAGFSFTATADGVKGVLTNESVILESANMEKYQTNTGTEEDPVYAAPNASTSFSIDPTSSAISATGSLGTITVKLAKYDGFVYDATGVYHDTLKNALQAAIEAGETKITVLGNTIYVMNAVKDALNSVTGYGTIDLTLQDITNIDASRFSFDGDNPAGRRLKTINLPNATTIGNNAFHTCDYLTSVTAPKVTSVGDSAFQSCSALTNIFMPEVTAVGERAFNDCDSLTSISLPKCETVQKNAFLGCTELTSIELSKVTTMGESAFEDCKSLTSVTFGTPVTAWGKNVFGQVDDYFKVSTENLTMTFAAGQKAFEGDNTNGWTVTETDLAAGTNVEFCGRTFKEIVVSAPTT